MHDWLIALLMLREPSCGINLFGVTEWMLFKSFYLKYVESCSDICPFLLLPLFWSFVTHLDLTNMIYYFTF